MPYTTLAANVLTTDTSITVTDPTVFPGSPVFLVQIGTEVMAVQNPIAGAVFPVLRAFGALTTYATDIFDRISTAAWDSSTDLHPWTVTTTSDVANYSVDGTQGIQLHSVLNTTMGTRLTTLQLAECEQLFRVASDQLAAGVGESIQAVCELRAVDTNNRYQMRMRWYADQTVKVQFRTIVAGVGTDIGSETNIVRETHAANTFFWVRCQATGFSPTTLNVKVWREGTAEPAGWDKTSSDSTAALQAPGATGLRSTLTAGLTNTLPISVFFREYSATSIPQGLAAHTAGDIVALYMPAFQVPSARLAPPGALAGGLVWSEADGKLAVWNGTAWRIVSDTDAVGTAFQ